MKFKTVKLINKLNGGLRHLIHLAGRDFAFILIAKYEDGDEIPLSTFVENYVNDGHGITGNLKFDYITETITISSNISNNNCLHQWVSTQLLYSTVYDCKHCGIKKEAL